MLSAEGVRGLTQKGRSGLWLFSSLFSSQKEQTYLWVP